MRKICTFNLPIDLISEMNKTIRRGYRSKYFQNAIYDKLKIEISGHTDNVGSREYNYTLSKNRAKSVYNALIHFGVNSQQLSYQGYGYDFL